MIKSEWHWHEPRYDYSTCAACGKELQNIDFAQHYLMCPETKIEEQRLPCGHLPGGCVRYEWHGQTLCSTRILHDLRDERKVEW